MQTITDVAAAMVVESELEVVEVNLSASCVVDETADGAGVVVTSIVPMLLVVEVSSCPMSVVVAVLSS